MRTQEFDRWKSPVISRRYSPHEPAIAEPSRRPAGPWTQVRIRDGFPVRVDGIEVSRQVADQADSGEKAGLLFTDLDKASVMRGQVITDYS